MAEFEHERVERFRRSPDSDQRLRGSDHPGGTHRRSRPWIAVAIGLLVMIAFVAIVLTDDGDDDDAPFGAPPAAATVPG